MKNEKRKKKKNRDREAKTDGFATWLTKERLLLLVREEKIMQFAISARDFSRKVRVYVYTYLDERMFFATASASATHIYNQRMRTKWNIVRVKPVTEYIPLVGPYIDINNVYIGGRAQAMAGNDRSIVCNAPPPEVTNRIKNQFSFFFFFFFFDKFSIKNLKYETKFQWKSH